MYTKHCYRSFQYDFVRMPFCSYGLPFCPIPFCLYTILSVYHCVRTPFCLIPFCPRTILSVRPTILSNTILSVYHFVQYHFVQYHFVQYLFVQYHFVRTVPRTRYTHSTCFTSSYRARCDCPRQNTWLEIINHPGTLPECASRTGCSQFIHLFLPSFHPSIRNRAASDLPLTSCWREP